jgi:hypothetical protein
MNESPCQPSTKPKLLSLARQFPVRTALLSLIVVWVLLRIYPIMHAEGWTNWEVWQARKLLDYGFFNRAGAALPSVYMTGRMPHPEDFNYTNHPYPMLWVYTAIYALGGPAACLTMILLVRLCATIVVFVLLRRYFSLGTAWWGTFLYALAPITLAMDVDSNAGVGFGAVIWPFSAFLASDPRQGRWHAWLLGLTVFVAGQISWFTLTLIPVLLMMTIPVGGSWHESWRMMLKSPKCRAILIGAVLTSLVFITQLAVYTADIPFMFEYIFRQMAARPAVLEVSRSAELRMVVLRTILFVGPALLLGAALGIVGMRRSDPNRRVSFAYATYFPIFALAASVLTHFFFIERSPYLYAVFPAAFLTAVCLERFRGVLFRSFLFAFSIVTATYIYITFSVPGVTNASRELGSFIGQHTEPDDVVLTNLRQQVPPYQSWDSAAGRSTGMISDRLLFLNITNSEGIIRIEGLLKRNFSKAVFVFDPSLSISPNLGETLAATGGPIARGNLTIVPEPVTFAQRLRELIWNLSGRYKQRGKLETPGPQKVMLEVYRLK